LAQTEFDICVIGGGAGGLVVAAGGSGIGAKVALVEKHSELGGDCLHYGCVPSKTLLHSAKVAHTMRDAKRFGVEPVTPQVSIPAVMQRVNSVIQSILPNDSPERFRGLGVDVIFGEGKFIDAHTFAVNGRNITAKNFVIATGSRPGVPPIPGLADLPYLTNETVFKLNEPVPSLIVIGAGPIGIEMAQAFCRLGSKVSVVDLVPQILPKEDLDASDVVRKQLEREGIAFYLGVTPQKAEGGKGDIRLSLKNKDGSETLLQATHILVAAGRRMNSENLGLEAAGIASEKGKIISNDRLQTSQKHIYLCGDIVGSYQFTHMAEHHAGIVLRNIASPLPARVENRVIPWATFTEPELARVGYSETEAKAANIEYQTYQFPFDDMDRARAEGETEGFAKILVDKKGVVIGATIVGPHAGELIHEYVLAITQKMKATDLCNIIHVYPTLSQINRRVADQKRKASFTPTAKKWLMRIAGFRGA
jgi:pyruvate/2-oxoglutarate dehydrogenase complex dihydrolipoamide dehydrogenase (E3) component